MASFDHEQKSATNPVMAICIRGVSLAFCVVGAIAIAGPARAQSDQTLRMGLSELSPTFGNPYHYTGRPYIYTLAATFDGLTRLDEDGNLQPWLAVSWERLDELRWQFRLRDDVIFSNGTPFTSDAVVTVVHYLKSEEAVVDVAGRYFKFLKGARAIDPHTVEIETLTPRPDLPRNLPLMYMVEPNLWRELGREGFAEVPVGTGPFKVDRYDGNNKVTLSAFEKSWRPPKLARVEITAMSDMAARVQAIQAGSLDLVMALGPEEASAVEAAGAVSHAWLDGSLWAINFISERSPPLQDVRVRKAINLAVNRAPLTEILLQGVSHPATQPASRKIFGYNPDLPPIPYDLDEARRLMADAGYGDGFTLNVEGVVGTGPGDGLVYQLIAQDLSKIGITMNFEISPVARLVRNAVQGGWKGEAFGLNYEFQPSFDALRALENHSCWWSHPWYCDERITPVMDEARAEFDPERALALRQQVMAFYRNEYASLFLYETPRFAGSTPRLKNFKVVNYYIDYSVLELAP